MERFLIGKGSNLALAILCSKMLIPIKVPAAMALTPYVQRCAGGEGANAWVWPPTRRNLCNHQGRRGCRVHRHVPGIP